MAGVSGTSGADRAGNRPGVRATADGDAGAVAELQGLYGPFVFSELLLQRLWLDREFDGSAARLQDGRTLEVLHPGQWNRLGGPDFRRARLRIDGRVVEGDVEVHLHAGDWRAHGHAKDPAYDGVVLHVVLFPPETVETAGGTSAPIPIFVLLPYLWRDLESYAADEAIAALANQPTRRLFAELMPLPREQLAELITAHAEQRWLQKVRHARLRIEKLGWEAACHHAALEILGYRFNRAPMLRVAGELQRSAWTAGNSEIAERAWAVGQPWSLHGVRPANHPRKRLEQFAAWQIAAPQWVESVEGWAQSLADAHLKGDAPIAAERRRIGLAARRAQWSATLTGDVLGGTRFDHFINDGLLPLSAAAELLPPADARGWWNLGYPGDLPDQVQRGLRDLGLGGVAGHPLATGPAQGLLGWLWAFERGG